MYIDNVIQNQLLYQYFLILYFNAKTIQIFPLIAYIHCEHAQN